MITETFSPMDDVELEELKERQENEVAALRSIFDASFQDQRTEDVWKVLRSSYIS